MQQIFNNKIDNSEKEDEKETKKSYWLKLYDEIKIGVKKNYKTLILITVVSIFILYMNYPNKNNSSDYTSKFKKMFGGDNEDGLNEKKGVNNDGEEKKKKKGIIGKLASPLDGANTVMWWIAKNIALLYFFLIFLVAIPTVPAILYIALFYFIMSGMLSKLGTI